MVVSDWKAVDWRVVDLRATDSRAMDVALVGRMAPDATQVQVREKVMELRVASKVEAVVVLGEVSMGWVVELTPTSMMAVAMAGMAACAAMPVQPTTGLLAAAHVLCL